MKFAYLIEPPFNYCLADGQVTGCDVALARHVFHELGVDTFEPVETEFAVLLPGLGAGRWRMTTGLFATEERRALAQFTRPIWALPDGLLVQAGNPRGLSGYASIAGSPDVTLAVIRDQFQHRTAAAFGIGDDRITLFETYTDAARHVRDGHVDAYASVGRAHSGFIAQNPNCGLEVVTVPAAEKPPAYGSFAVSLGDDQLLADVNAVLAAFLGSDAHRRMVAAFGFSDAEVDLVADWSAPTR